MEGRVAGGEVGGRGSVREGKREGRVAGGKAGGEGSGRESGRGG